MAKVKRGVDRLARTIERKEAMAGVVRL